MRKAIYLKLREFWANNFRFLHHDNAPSDTALVLRDFWFDSMRLLANQLTHNVNAGTPFWYDWGNINPIEVGLEGYTWKRLFNDMAKVWRWPKCVLSNENYFEGYEFDLKEKTKNLHFINKIHLTFWSQLVYFTNIQITHFILNCFFDFPIFGFQWQTSRIELIL